MGPQAREMLQSPVFRQMMTNPEIIRQNSRMRNMMGGGRGSAFPAPGVTDNTPQDAASTPTNNNNPNRPAGLGDADLMNLLGGEGAANPFAGNPFAAFLNPRGRGQTPAQTPPPPASAGQGTPANAATPGDAPANPFASAWGVPPPPPSGLASMMTPETMQQALQMLQDPQFAAMMGGGEPGAAGGAANPFGMTPEMMRQAMQMFGAGGGAGAPGGAAGLPNFGSLFGNTNAPPTPADTRPPEERYAEQLRQLNDMGFFEFDRNVEALRRSGGNVHGAVEQLLNGS